MSDKTRDELDREAAEAWINETAPKVFRALESADINYNDELLCHAMEDGFLAGIQHERARLQAEIEGYRNDNEVLRNWISGCAKAVDQQGIFDRERLKEENKKLREDHRIGFNLSFPIIVKELEAEKARHAEEMEMMAAEVGVLESHMQELIEVLELVMHENRGANYGIAKRLTDKFKGDRRDG